jgi:hypothetical protein
MRAVHYVGSFAADTEAEFTLYHVIRSFGLGFPEDLCLRDEDIGAFVEEANFFTDGCGASVACGSLAADSPRQTSSPLTGEDQGGGDKINRNSTT